MTCYETELCLDQNVILGPSYEKYQVLKPNQIHKFDNLICDIKAMT